MNFVFQQESFDPIHAALFTDLYELTTVQAYWAHRMIQPVTFEIDPDRPNGIMEMAKMVYEAEKDGDSGDEVS